MNARFFLNVPVILFCLVAGLTAAEAAERAAEKIRIAVSSKSLGFLDTWAARERGFYRRQGLDVEIIAMRPPLTIGAIQAGETVLDQQGKPDLPLERVVDSTLVEEVLRERR